MVELKYEITRQGDQFRVNKVQWHGRRDHICDKPTIHKARRAVVDDAKRLCEYIEQDFDTTPILIDETPLGVHHFGFGL